MLTATVVAITRAQQLMMRWATVWSQ